MIEHVAFLLLNCRRTAVVHLIALSACVLIGCDQSAAPPQPATQAKRNGTNESASPRESWSAYFMQGRKIGFGQTVEEPIERGGKHFVRTRSTMTMVVERFGQRSEQKVRTESLETADGEVVEVRTEAGFGTEPSTTLGQVQGGQLVLASTSGGPQASVRIPWSEEIRGFHAEEQSLRRSPPKSGERRTFKMLLPILNQVGSVQLSAGDWETVQLLDRQERLLRVESVVMLPQGNELATTYWIDARGEILKAQSEATQQEQYLVSRAVAEDSKGLGGFDIGRDVIVQIERKLHNPHELSALRYRVTLEGGDSSKVFATSETQSVETAGEHKVTIATRRFRVAEADVGSENDEKRTDQPSDEDRQPNALIESDNALVVELAGKGRDGAADPAAIAQALERSVHELIQEKNFSQAFSTAAQVAKSREGDCTEHAVLLAAMLRASRIPARVAVGLVYVSDLEGFGYHMWTEAFVNGRWAPLDATLGRGGIGPAHLKLAHTNLAGASPYSSFLPVAQVLGRLKIEVLDDKPLPSGSN